MRIFIGGDITPTDITKPGFEAGDVKGLFGTVPELLKTGDVRFANLECALTESDTPIRKCGPNLRAKPVSAQVLKALDFTVIGLSNNHVFDFGCPGFDDTMKTLDDWGITYTGVGKDENDARKPCFIKVCGKTVAFLCVAEHEYSYALPDREGVWGFDPFDTMEDITEAKKNADYVIVVYHGGKEQCRYPSPRLRKACQAMVRAGADFITCQHSHCVGVWEEYRGAKIVYGQGNFNFVEHSDHPHWRNGSLLQLDIGDDNSTALTFHSLCVTDTGITLSEGAEKEKELRELAERTALLQNEAAWLAEWHDFCVSKKEGYREGVARAFRDNPTDVPAQIFPHYLDCEAHTDVWRELYPTWHKDKSDEV